MYDIFANSKTKIDQNHIVDRLGLVDKKYSVLTTHRAENVDDPAKLKSMLQVMKNTGLPIVFPIYPRTKNMLAESGISLNSTNIRSIDPLGCIEMLALLKHAKIAITGSGGLQKEAFRSKIPCITIRDRTEWTETVDLGGNFATDVDPAKITQVSKYAQDDYNEIRGRFTINPFGEGNASAKIVNS